MEKIIENILVEKWGYYDENCVLDEFGIENGRVWVSFIRYPENLESEYDEYSESVGEGHLDYNDYSEYCGQKEVGCWLPRAISDEIAELI